MVLCVHEIVQDELLNTVADGVHTAGVFQRIAAFVIFRDPFDLHTACTSGDFASVKDVHLNPIPSEADAGNKFFSCASLPPAFLEKCNFLRKSP